MHDFSQLQAQLPAAVPAVGKGALVEPARAGRARPLGQRNGSLASAAGARLQRVWSALTREGAAHLVAGVTAAAGAFTGPAGAEHCPENSAQRIEQPPAPPKTITSHWSRWAWP
jgi:hypothetical protein